MNPCIWTMYECGGGSRWTSTENSDNPVLCNFSGCCCGTQIKKVGRTTDINEADKWFRKPLVDKRHPNNL